MWRCIEIMLRGVNKKIIEINNVEGGYFEKVLFFVKDDSRSEPDSVRESQAEKYVSDSCALKYRRRFLTWDNAKFLMKMAASAGLGIAIGMLLF